MKSPPETKLGFVPSLEAMPLVRAACEGAEAWQARPRAGYGSIIRSLLTGELQAGLVPWELFVTELYLQPRQAEQWCVPLVTHAGAVELVLSAAARKRLYPAKTAKPTVPGQRLTFAIEARRSLAKFQIRSWLSRFPSALGGKPAFRVLPMELMLQGLGENVIDGIVAPAPWGLQAEAMGVGKRENSFEVGRFGQQVVLACSRETVSREKASYQILPARVEAARKELASDPPAFLRTAAAMHLSGHQPLDSALLAEAAALYPPDPAARDFTPPREWLMSELQNLVGLLLVPSDSGDTGSMAERLALAI